MLGKQASYDELAASGFSTSITGRLREAVGQSAQTLTTRQPAGSERMRGDYEAVVWRGVALAFAEFDTFNDWTPPPPRPRAAKAKAAV